MNTATIRQQLHNYLEVADDKKINALYTIIEKEIQEKEFEYPENLKNELDKRYAAYKNGSEKMVTASQSKKRIEKILKAGKLK
ncbi:MAG TPA: hypothetical protein VGP43_11985 [Chitinophagaceae bacterium]|nr:hypothetical protein [Chitinophagaceae bacterium]